MRRGVKIIIIVLGLIVLFVSRSEYNIWRINKLIDSASENINWTANLEIDSLKFDIISNSMMRLYAFNHHTNTFTDSSSDSTYSKPAYESIYSPTSGIKLFHKQATLDLINIDSSIDVAIQWIFKTDSLSAGLAFFDKGNDFGNYSDPMNVFSYFFARTSEGGGNLSVEMPIEGEWNKWIFSDTKIDLYSQDGEEETRAVLILNDSLFSKRVISKIYMTSQESYNSKWLVGLIDYQDIEGLVLPKKVTLFELWKNPDSTNWISTVSFNNYQVFQ